ncbi:Vacuolar sorting protein 9 [Globisporangium polare]
MSGGHGPPPHTEEASLPFIRPPTPQKAPQTDEQSARSATAKIALDASQDSSSVMATLQATAVISIEDERESKAITVTVDMMATNGSVAVSPVVGGSAIAKPRKPRPIGLQIDTSGIRTSPHPGRAREKQSGTHSSYSAGVGAPSVWISPEWTTYPIIENFYGQPRRTRVNSFYEVMCSPTNPMQTTTLAENCCAYDVEEDGDAMADEDAHERRRRTGSSGATATRTRANGRRKFGSFSYSCSTETSEDVDILTSPFEAASLRELHGDNMHRQRRGHSTEEAKGKNAPPPPGSGSGFAAWNRIRRTVGDGHELVPVPHAGANTAALHLNGPHATNGMNASRFGNPQAGSAEHSPMESVSYPESPAATPPTTSRLRSKLKESLSQIDRRISSERDLAQKAQSKVKKVTKQPTNVMWNLFCGAKTYQISQTDGLAFLHEQLSVAVHNRALNQLQRHRRHVNGILQIVTSHNPDLELTEKQLDSFESADDMLGSDIKYSLLRKQVDCMASNIVKRKEAVAHARIRNGPDCFEIPRAKSTMLAKLLEAVSWYRLVQTNSREESASSSVVASTYQDGDVLESSSSAASIASTSRSLQEIQVEKILNVLAGEEFYSDYNELMCKPDWWEIAQAHFENLVFSKSDSRICQWMNRMSNDVASVSQETLEDLGASSAPVKHGRVLSERRQSFSEGVRSQSAKLLHQQPPNWASDPQPEQILDFMDRLTRRIRREFDVPNEVSKSLNFFVQRAVFPRVAVLCFNQKAVRDCQRKDKLWRKKCIELSGINMENLNVPSEIAEKIRSQLPSRRTHATHGKHVYLIRSIEAFNGMSNIVPCDLLEELMHGVVILHHEAALVLGTTQFSVETFFPLLAYVLLHCQLPRIHAQLHLLENYAITNSNVNGEESYYVYCVHAAVEYVCNSAGLSMASPPKDQELKASATPNGEPNANGIATSAASPVGEAVSVPVV